MPAGVDLFIIKVHRIDIPNHHDDPSNQMGSKYRSGGENPDRQRGIGEKYRHDLEGTDRAGRKLAIVVMAPVTVINKRTVRKVTAGISQPHNGIEQ